jgi:hypothetical protein
VTLLAVQILIGYEWLASGITKIASGTFESGLAANLRESSQDAWHGYKSFLSSSAGGCWFSGRRCSLRLAQLSWR